jgi:hypothetical protein
VNADQSHGDNPPQNRPHQPKGIYDLSGTTVVVTGGNDGIGAALARGVGLAGAAVAIWARNDDRNRATVASLRAEGIDAWSVACDVAVETAGPLPVCVFTGKNGQPARDRRCSSFLASPASSYHRLHHRRRRWHLGSLTSVDAASAVHAA